MGASGVAVCRGAYPPEGDFDESLLDEIAGPTSSPAKGGAGGAGGGEDGAGGGAGAGGGEEGAGGGERAGGGEEEAPLPDHQPNLRRCLSCHLTSPLFSLSLSPQLYACTHNAHAYMPICLYVNTTHMPSYCITLHYIITYNNVP